MERARLGLTLLVLLLVAPTTAAQDLTAPPSATTPAALDAAAAPSTNATTTTASPDAALTKNGELTVEAVQAKQKKIETAEDLDPDVKTKLLEVYGKTLEQLRAAAATTAETDLRAKQTREAPETLPTLKAELARPAPTAPTTLPSDASFAQAQQLLTTAEVEAAEAQTGLQALQDEVKRRADRRLEIPKLAETAKTQLAELEKQLAAQPAADEASDVIAASRQLLEARKKAVSAEIAGFQTELQFYDATAELLSARRDLAARTSAAADERVKTLRLLVNERRKQEAERQATDAQSASAQGHPVVRGLAETNADLARQRQALADKIEHTVAESDRINRQLTTLAEQYKKVTKRFETAGGTETMGLLLRKQRDELPDTRVHAKHIRHRSDEIADTYLQLIDYEEKRNELATLDQPTREILDGVAVTSIGRKVLESEVHRILETQRTLYDSLIADVNSYLETLVELDTRERQLIKQTDEFAEYCNERILWIRSATVFSVADFRHLSESVHWLIAPENWKQVGATLWSDVIDYPWLAAIVGLTVLLLLSSQRRLRRMVAESGERAARSSLTSYLPTLEALAATFLLAILWPAVIGYLGLRLVAANGEAPFVAAVGHGLQVTAVVFGTLELFRQLCRKHGLGEAHFDWDAEALRAARVADWWFMAVGLPLVLVVTITEWQSNEVYKNSLGRPAFVGVLLTLVFCLHRVVRPNRGALDKLYAAAPQSWGTRLRRVWHLLALAAPVALAALAVLGYYYTAIQLAVRMLATLWLLIGSLIVYAALLRWSLLSYRELAIRKARERRATVEASPSTPAVTQPEVTLSDISKRSHKALRLALTVGLVAGLWLVWIDVLPALGALKQVELWTVETTGTGASAAATVLQAITLADLLLAAVTAALTFAAARNLPSLLEMAVLQRLPLDPGARYAATTVMKYAITAAGVTFAFGVIGIGWSKVQWLVAAIGVGLGFGLQEIFANFVSGLILLFERPVRLGDIVTVGDVTGHVTRIQMRATTITDWDMRELVVPNKEFVTGRLMNWTLSSTVSRMSINVGVAYGTDPDKVREILLRVAAEHPLVLKDPPAHALFDEFADSTLNFVLRVYMGSRSVYLELRHELLADIAREFAKADVEIAFPQRDIHIRTTAVESGRETVPYFANGGNGNGRSARGSSHDDEAR